MSAQDASFPSRQNSYILDITEYFKIHTLRPVIRCSSRFRSCLESPIDKTQEDHLFAQGRCNGQPADCQPALSGPPVLKRLNRRRVAKPSIRLSKPNSSHSRVCRVGDSLEFLEIFGPVPDQPEDDPQRQRQGVLWQGRGGLGAFA